MRLSDIKGDRTLEVIADIIDPIANIAEDDEAAALFKREKQPEGVTPKKFQLKRVRKSAPALLKGHKADIINTGKPSRGEKGEQGEVGPEGKQGVQGPPGPQGINGVAVAAEGQYAFNVNEDGDLIVTYTGTEAPDFYIADDGTLRLRIA